MTGREDGAAIGPVGENTPAVILDMPGLDGILGNTFLNRYTITLDAERGVLVMRAR